MKDFKSFLTEAYDKDEKKLVLSDFTKFLDERLNGKIDPDTNQHVGSNLWWALGTGDGKYKDCRLTIGTKNTKLLSEYDWRTLNFYVTDDGQLTAYLDADDYEMLDNILAYNVKSKKSKKKEMWSFYLGATNVALHKAFNAALNKIQSFFDSWDDAKQIIDDTKASYNKNDLERLDKLVKSRAEQKYIAWTKDDETQLQNAVSELAIRKKQLLNLKNAKMATEYNARLYKKNNGRIDRSSLNDIGSLTYKIEQLQKRIEGLKTDIKMMEEDKLSFMQKQKDILSTRRLNREQHEDRMSMIKKLGLDMNDAVGYSDEQLSDMLNRSKMIKALELDDDDAAELSTDDLSNLMRKKFTKTGKLRKQRTVKTGDISAYRERERENLSRARKQAIKNFEFSL